MGFRMWLALWVGIGVSVSLITTDIYLPSMPDMASYFAVGEDTIQMTITLGYLGMVPAGILSGGLSDVFGRRPLILYGLLLVAFGGVLYVLTPIVGLLFFGRLLQGFGTGTLCVVGMALVHDLYPKEEGALALSYLGAIFCIGPIFAPILGGLIHISLGWQANFLLIVIVTFAVASIIFQRLEMPLSEKTSETASERSSCFLFEDYERQKVYG
ncbi:MAG: DHA1 family bicyclomycin/chloramphenicol resistance-like MFS transporter, partial [Chlamydiales bacterium]